MLETLLSNLTVQTATSSAAVVAGIIMVVIAMIKTLPALIRERRQNRKTALEDCWNAHKRQAEHTDALQQDVTTYRQELRRTEEFVDALRTTYHEQQVMTNTLVLTNTQLLKGVLEKLSLHSSELRQLNGKVNGEPDE